MDILEINKHMVHCGRMGSGRHKSLQDKAENWVEGGVEDASCGSLRDQAVSASNGQKSSLMSFFGCPHGVSVALARLL